MKWIELKNILKLELNIEKKKGRGFLWRKQKKWNQKIAEVECREITGSRKLNIKKSQTLLARKWARDVDFKLLSIALNYF